MKHYVLLILFFCSSSLFAQQDNYSFIKLMVFNNENKVMLVKWNGEWEIPGMRYNKLVTLSEFVDILAKEHGITVQNKKLNGIFTFKYDNRPTLTIMHYYTATYNNGKFMIPESCEDIGWFTVNEAINSIPYKEMKLILSKINSQPNTLCGGAIKKSNDNNIELIEDFYKLK